MRKLQAMELHFVFVGKTAFPDIDQTVKRYLKKIRGFFPVSVHVVKEEKETRHRNPAEIMDKEAEKILKLVERNGYIVSWDRTGKMITSEEYASLFRQWMDKGLKSLWMIVGGALGLSPVVLNLSNEVISLSPMTFPHDLVRAIIAEQTYRAISIINGIPYHK